MQTLSTVLAGLALAGIGFAQQTLIIPSTVDHATEGVTRHDLPWGHDGFSAGTDSVRVQYLYDSSHFAGVVSPIYVERVRFRADNAPTFRSGLGGFWQNTEIRVGAAGTAWDNAFTTFAMNWPGGVEPAPAYAGPVVVQPWSGNHDGNPGDWWVDVTLTTPVYYDPRLGDPFLLDVKNDGLLIGTVNDLWYCDEDFDGCRTSRIHTTQGWNILDGVPSTHEQGLVCELSYVLAGGRYANFVVDNRTPGPNQPIRFTDLSVSDQPGGIIARLWDFDGDGTTDSQDPNPFWSYPACGSYTVELSVLDATGYETFRRTDYIVVDVPKPDFTYTYSGASPVTVQFTDSSNGNPTSWAWDFDRDGIVDSTLQNPTWTFPTRGVHDVRLTASNACATSPPFDKRVDTRLQLCTAYANNTRNGGAGWSHYFDVDVTDPAGITVTQVGAQSNQNPGVSTQLEVWVTPGTHVGNETNQAAWTRVGFLNSTPPYAPSGGWGGETLYDLTDFYLAPGRHGIAILYPLGGPRYPIGQMTQETYANQDLSMTFGTMRSGPFSGTRFERRTWNGCFYYCEGNGQGTVALLGTGCTNSTGSTASLVSQAGAPPAIGQPFALEMSNAPASEALSFLVIGVANLGGIDLGVIGMPGCALYPEPMVSLPAPTDATGFASGSFTISANRDTIGFPIYAQGIVADAGTNALGAVVSDALQAVVGCR